MRAWAAWIADREIWPLCVGVALATFTSRWAPWGLGLIAALWLVRWVARGHLTVRTPLDWPVGLILLMVPITFYATTDRLVTFVQVSRLLAGLGLLYGLINWTRRGAHVSLLALGLTGVGLGLALIAPFAVGWSSTQALFASIPTSLPAGLAALFEDTVNANMLAGALAMLLPFPLASLVLAPAGSWPSLAGVLPRPLAWLLDRPWLRRLASGTAVLSMLTVIVLSRSRGAWVATLMAVFVVLVRRWRPLIWLIPVAFLALGLLAWQGELPKLLEAVGSTDAVPNLERRAEIWRRALYIIQDFPFTGIGAGTFPRVTRVLYPLFRAGPDSQPPHAHNLLLQVGVDLGIPGLVAFLAMLALALWSAVDSARFYARAGVDALAAAAWAGLTSLVAMLIHGTVDATTWILGRGAFVPFAVLGALVALERRPEVSVPAAGQRRTLVRWLRAHPFVTGLLVSALLVAAAGGAAWAIQRGQHLLPGAPQVRLPVYPGAQNVDVRAERPSEGSGWTGPLEIATFTTTHPITDVVAFYTDTLDEAGWETDIETGDATSWGGIYTQDGGRSVCLLNLFDIEGEVWISIVCGDKNEPVDLPPLPPTPSPETGTPEG